MARRSAAVFRAFAWYLKGYLRRHFHAVRVARDMATWPLPGRAVIVYSNHPSWWDPALFIVLSARLFAERRSFGPMDAAALRRYPILERAGVFGIDLASRGGAAHFLRACDSILADPGNMLWLTGEGRLSDSRVRPVCLRPGLAHLVRRHPHALIMPLALDYSFWNESRPEALCRFGAPIEGERLSGLTCAQSTAYLEAELTRTLDALAAHSMQRDSAPFRSVLHGASGVGGVYDLWRRAVAWTRATRFDPSHGGPP